MPLNHALGAGSHRNGKNNNERRRNHRHTGPDGVNDNLLLRREVIGSQHDDGADDGNEEQDEGKLRELPLERRANSETEEASKGIPRSEQVGNTITTNVSGPVFLPFNRSTARFLSSKRSGNLPDLSKHAGSEDDATRPTLGHGRRAISDIETVTRACIFVESQLGIFADRKRLSSKQCFIGLKVESLDKTNISWDSVAGFKVDHVSRHNLHGGDDYSFTTSYGARSRGAQGSERVHGLRGLELLSGTDSDVDDNDGGYHTAFNPRLDTE